MDNEFLNYIDLIKNKATDRGFFKNREVYKINNLYVNFYTYKGQYLNSLQYITESDIMWTMTHPKDFYLNHCSDNNLIFQHYSTRRYGEPKLNKPKELKGVKQSFSVDYVPKLCKCQCFILENDVYIQHRDYFSEDMKVKDEDIGLPLTLLCKKYLTTEKDQNRKFKTFIYTDCWGGIVLRNEAWIVLKNLVYRLSLGESEYILVEDILRQQEKLCLLKPNELEIGDMARFWENVIKETKRY